jgi:predicted nucleic acid-binding protein
MPAARVRLTMHGQGISLSELGRALHQFQLFTSAVADERQVNAATWRIEDLRTGSAVAVASLDIPGDGVAFAEDLLTGVNAINAAPRVPDEFGLRALPSLGAMGRVAQHHPVQAELMDSQLATVIDLTTAKNVRTAGRATSESIGGFYGTVQLLDSRKTPKFGIRDEFRRAVDPMRSGRRLHFRRGHQRLPEQRAGVRIRSDHRERRPPASADSGHQTRAAAVGQQERRRVRRRRQGFLRRASSGDDLRRDRPYKDTQALLDRAGGGDWEIVGSILLFAEVLGPGGAELLSGSVRTWVTIERDVIMMVREFRQRAIAEQRSAGKVPDLIHIATAVLAGAQAFISTDSDCRELAERHGLNAFDRGKYPPVDARPLPFAP